MVTICGAIFRLATLLCSCSWVDIYGVVLFCWAWEPIPGGAPPQ